ncbi:hypothetical protein GCM10027185_62020 [Spirosoma pulveris]
MVGSWEVYFDEPCPTIDRIVERVNQQLDSPARYLSDKWLLVTDSEVLNLYPGNTHNLVITDWVDTANLVQVLLTTLEAMGGLLSLG